MRWRKSSRSGSTSNCVELAATPRTRAVRDSKNVDGGALTFTTATFAGFLTEVKSGRFER
ncbi:MULTISPECIES: DUF397 domain-containing protein [Saccharothrix]|uniref:DUF397 domain-containing protein n=1 Tax=Saccharothrix TaxID=2071 RepID=UPI00093B6441|nr:DUF397 domain-containing protein [Saccharothrix sp. CB00851]OKI36232.1 DUF397 domain-containing protein [Saccharothrix sp. CB00851]